MRRAPAILVAIVMLVEPAAAGELSTYDPIGFSSDGGTFAFAQHGVTDGAGAPYAEAAAIDVAADAFLPDTPVRRGGGEPGDLSPAETEAALAGLRAEVRSLVDAAVGGGRWRRGDLLAFSPVTDLDRDGRGMTVNPRHIPTVIDGAITASLTMIPFPEGTNGCPDGAPVIGFRLTLEEGGDLVTLNEDAGVPASRGCPTGYRIGGIETYHAPDGTRSLAVLVQMLTIGFEGPNGRWLAVTHRGSPGRD